MKNIAILASGNGTNCDNIIRYFHNDSNIRVAMVLTNNPKAKVIEKARTQGVKVYIMAKEEFNDKEQLLPILAENSIELIVLAGFLLFLPEFLVSAYPNGIINIHPSLLPAFRGAHAVEQAVEYGVKVYGITIHYVNSELDGGRIIAQRAFEYDGDDPAEVHRLGQKIEHALYVETISRLLNNK